MAVKKCPICKKTYNEVDSLAIHIETEHSSEIPKDWSGGKYYFFRNNGKTTGKCVVCRKDTTFNESTCKTNRFCPNPKCPVIYREYFLKRMVNTHGKETLLDDAEHQKKMLSNRSIAKDYKWSDDSIKRAIGTYEYDACQFLDIFMQLESNDVMVPAPQVLEYEYEGTRRKYIPDIYIASLNLIVEIKDGGDNPNMHHKIQSVDKVKEKEKERALKNYSFNYIKIENKQYGEFVNLFMKLKNMDKIEAKRFDPIIITNEMVNFDLETDYNIDIISFRDKTLNLFEEVGLLVHDRLYVYNRENIEVINIDNVEIIDSYDLQITGNLSRTIYNNMEFFMSLEFEYPVHEINFPLAFIYEIFKQLYTNYNDTCGTVIDGLDEYIISEVNKLSDYDNIKGISKRGTRKTYVVNDVYHLYEDVKVCDAVMNVGEYTNYTKVVTDIYNANRLDLVNYSNIDTKRLYMCIDVIDKALSLKEIEFARNILEIDPSIDVDFKLRAMSLLNNKEDLIKALEPSICEYSPLLSSPNLLNLHYTKIFDYDKKYNGLAKRVSESIATGLIDCGLLDEIADYVSKLDSNVSDEELYYLGVKSI